MRWEFWDGTDAAETRERTAVIEAMDRWWAEFSRRADDIDRHFTEKAEFDVPAWMEGNLGPVSPDLCWEFGPAVKKEGHRLSITPESSTHLRPLTRILLSRAPKLPRWEFYGFRLIEPFEQACESVRGIHHVNTSAFRVRAALAPDNRIDLRFAPGEGEAISDQDVQRGGFWVTERLLGEEALDVWVGGIECDRSALQDGIRLDRLKPTVDALIQATLDQVSDDKNDRLNLREEAEWSLFELQPADRAEYSGHDDLFVAVTSDVRLFRAAHFSPVFYSRRFSRSDQMFCYLKIDGRNGLDPSGFADRGEIEDALNDALRSAGLGAVWGGGTGRIYSYVDLILGNVRPAIELIRKVLRRGKIPRRTWLLFFERDLAHEWVGIWDDTPAPPLPKPHTSAE